MTGLTQNPMEEEQKCRKGKDYKGPTCYVGLQEIAIDKIESQQTPTVIETPKPSFHQAIIAAAKPRRVTTNDFVQSRVTLITLPTRANNSIRSIGKPTSILLLYNTSLRLFPWSHNLN